MLFDIFSGWPMAVIIVTAYALDLLFGDPEWMPHPVRWIGALIARLESLLRPLAAGPGGLRIAGAVTALIAVFFTFFISYILLLASLKLSLLLFFVICVYMAWTAISARSLEKEALSVMSAIRRSDLEKARERLGRIVGRDTKGLSEEEITRAVIETVSENTSDGVIAPLFFLALGGPPLALAYKAVNTLDSMVGYKNARYRDFGWFSARLDDAANFIPARITAYLMVFAAYLLGLDWQGALRSIKKDATAHPSPNAGFPEAAVAGALRVQLGGGAVYDGVLSKKPVIGASSLSPTSSEATATIRIMHAVAFAFVLITSALVMVL